MRSTYLLAFLYVAACGGNDVDPRVIPGGGVGDGEIDGELNVHVIDDNDEPVVGATMSVGGTEQETDENGLAVFGDVSGRQTIAVLADGFRSVVWVGVDGANVTIPVQQSDVAAIEQATLSGTITGWDTIAAGATLPLVRAAFIFYSQTDDLGDDANNLVTPSNGNFCGALQQVCNWQLTSRAGSVRVVAAIVEVDTNGTPEDTDDTIEIIGWAARTDPLTVEDGVNQTGLTLEPVEAGNLQTVTIDFGAPPAGLPETAAVIGIELGDDEVVQIPVLGEGIDSVLVPSPDVFGSGLTYRLTAVAQTTSGDLGAQSIVLRRGLTGTDLAAGDWLVPPTGLVVTRTGASWEPVDGAIIHQVSYRDVDDEPILEITVFDNSTSITVPDLVALPATGTLTARVGAIGATLNVNSFSLDEDSDKLFAIAAEPTDVD